MLYLHRQWPHSYLVIFLLLLFLYGFRFLILFVGPQVRFLPHVGCSLRSCTWFSSIILTCQTSRCLDMGSRPVTHKGIAINLPYSHIRLCYMGSCYNLVHLTTEMSTNDSALDPSVWLMTQYFWNDHIIMPLMSNVALWCEHHGLCNSSVLSACIHV